MGGERIMEALLQVVTAYCLRGEGLARFQNRCLQDMTRCISRRVVTPRNSMEVYARCLNEHNRRIGRYRR